MDDLLGQKAQTTLEEAWHNEQKRKQYDIIRVASPKSITLKGVTYDLPNEPFLLEYDTNQYQRIEFDSEVDIPYYMARGYVEHKKDDIINFITKKMHDEYLAERDKKGLPRYTDKFTENKETYETQDYPKSNDVAVVTELYDQLWLGMVHEFGKDRPTDQRHNARSGEVDLTPVSMQAINSMGKKRIEGADVRAFQPRPFTPPIQKPSQTVPQQPSRS